MTNVPEPPLAMDVVEPEALAVTTFCELSLDKIWLEDQPTIGTL